MSHLEIFIAIAVGILTCSIAPLSIWLFKKILNHDVEIAEIKTQIIDMEKKLDVQIRSQENLSRKVSSTFIVLAVNVAKIGQKLGIEMKEIPND